MHWRYETASNWQSAALQVNTAGEPTKNEGGGEKSGKEGRNDTRTGLILSKEQTFRDVTSFRILSSFQWSLM